MNTENTKEITNELTTKEKEEAVIEKLKKELKKIDDKDFTFYFFVLDTKGNPSGSLTYVYDTALALKNAGYNVCMLHQEKEEFVGVESWLGEKYNVLLHKNIEKGDVDVSLSDVLIIPEIFVNVMVQTKKLPCKKVILLQNFDYLVEFMPMSATIANLEIKDVITNSLVNEKLIKAVAPSMNVNVISPCVHSIFRKSSSPKKLIINIVTKDQSDINKIVKPFYWKYPMYTWVTFRDLRGLAQDAFAAALSESPVTIWADDTANFGYSLIESVKSGAITFGKLPNRIIDWTLDEKGEIINSVLWFENFEDIHDKIASVVNTWMNDGIPQELYDEMDKLKTKTQEDFNSEVVVAYLKYVDERKTVIEKTIEAHTKE